jgi:hypothetical protein
MAEIKKTPIPKAALRNMPRGVERLNTLDCRYYALSGYNKKRHAWYEGTFISWGRDIMRQSDMPDNCLWRDAERIMDLKELVWWKVPGWEPGPRHREFMAL